MRDFSKEDHRVELVRVALDVLPESHPRRQKLVEKLGIGRDTPGLSPDTSVRQWLGLVPDITVRDLIDLLADIEKIRSAGAEPPRHVKP